MTEEALVDGLTETEWAYLKTPIRSLEKDQIFMAIACRDKLDKNNQIENEAYRKELADKRKFPESVLEATDERTDTDQIPVSPDTSARSGIPVD